MKPTLFFVIPAAALCLMTEPAWSSDTVSPQTIQSGNTPEQKVTETLLTQKVKKVTDALKGTAGVAVQMDGKKQFAAGEHLDQNFPMLSVFKFPLSLAVLTQVDQGKLSLDQQITVTKDMMDAETWSPMREEHPDGGVFSLARLLEYCVSSSDNNACDILFDLVGGPAKVDAFLEARYGPGKGITISCSEQAFKNRQMMYANHSTPVAMNMILKDFYEATREQAPAKPILKKNTAQFLWNIMTHSAMPTTCLKAQLPPDAVLAHKTGYSGTKDGFIIARNDVGIIMLPNGRYAIVSVFIRDCKDPLPVMEKAIGDIGKIVADALQQSPGDH